MEQKVTAQSIIVQTVLIEIVEPLMASIVRSLCGPKEIESKATNDRSTKKEEGASNEDVQRPIIRGIG